MMRFLLLFSFLLIPFFSIAQPSPEYDYRDRYAHPHKSNFSTEFKFAFAALDGSNCNVTDVKSQNNFLNPKVSLGLGYQYTHYINVLFRLGYFRYHCYTDANTKQGIRGDNFDGYVAIKHYVFPIRDYDEYLRRYNFYALAGIGTQYVNPKDAITLTPLADQVEFNQWALMVPLGLGAEIRLSDFFLMGLEYNYYLTNSDILDGVPQQNATASAKDNFMTVGVNVTYRIPNKDFIYDRLLKYKKQDQ